MLDWNALDFTGLANAFLVLITGTIMTAAVAIGRRAKPEQEPQPASETKISGAAIMSSEAVVAFAGSVEALGMEMIKSRTVMEKATSVAERAAIVAKESADDLVRAQERVRDASERHREALLENTRDTELLRQEVRDLAREMGHRR